MSRISFEQLLQAGAHFGHLKSKWNPAMAPYILMEKNGIHIIDLNKTIAKLDEAAAALKQVAKSGKRILFVATKKQAKHIVAERMKNLSVNMPYVTERWPGGMLTNFATIRKSIRKMAAIDKMGTDGTLDTMNKKERLMISRLRGKLQTQFGSISDMSRTPAAVFIVDIVKEHIAVAEAKRLNVPIYAIVDTNSNPNLVDFPIPANDDASTSIALIMDVIVQAVDEGWSERKSDREKEKEAEEKEAAAETDNTDKKLELIETEEEVIKEAVGGAKAVRKENSMKKPFTNKKKTDTN